MRRSNINAVQYSPPRKFRSEERSRQKPNAQKDSLDTNNTLRYTKKKFDVAYSRAKTVCRCLRAAAAGSCAALCRSSIGLLGGGCAAAGGQGAYAVCLFLKQSFLNSLDCIPALGMCCGAACCGSLVARLSRVFKNTHLALLDVDDCAGRQHEKKKNGFWCLHDHPLSLERAAVVAVCFFCAGVMVGRLPRPSCFENRRLCIVGDR